MSRFALVEAGVGGEAIEIELRASVAIMGMINNPKSVKIRSGSKLNLGMESATN